MNTEQIKKIIFKSLGLTLQDIKFSCHITKAMLIDRDTTLMYTSQQAHWLLLKISFTKLVKKSIGLYLALEGILPLTLFNLKLQRLPSHGQFQ